MDVTVPMATTYPLQSNQQLTPDQQAALGKLHKVATQFEGLFVGMLLKEMRKSESDDTIFGQKSNGEKIFGEMLDEQRAQSMANTGAFGIGAILERQMRGAVLRNAAQEAKTNIPGGIR